MFMFEQYDIMLEQFLQRYCCLFNSMCPSCNLPMLGHVRRYVHSLGCVHVYLTEDLTRSDPKSIYFTSWCSICNATTPTVPLSDSAKCLSLAKYLEMRFHGHAYKRRPPTDGDQSNHCEHSLHRDYVHHFSFRGVGAKFQYTPIEVWETDLPPLTLQLDLPKPFLGSQVQEEIKNFSVRGHEVYTRIHERIADLASEDENTPLVQNLTTMLTHDQFIFKQKIEIVHTLLTERRANAYDINDALAMARRSLAESIELWGPRLLEVELEAQKLSAKQAVVHHVDAGTEELRPEQAPTSAGDDGSSNSSNVAPVECPSEDTEPPAGSQPVPDKKFSIDQLLASSASVHSDKKSIRSILTQLLPSTNQANPLQSPFLSQDHLTLPMGSIPIHVRETDLSSVIAYSLTSADYQRALDEAFSSVGGEAPAAGHSSPQLKRKVPLPEGLSDAEESSPNLSRTSSKTSATPGGAVPAAATSSESEEKIKERNNTQPQSPSPHVSLAFNDNGCQFQCKIYFAREFGGMRAKSLQPPKLDRSLYRKLEKSKMREELRISQSRTGSEMELVRKPSDVSGGPPLPRTSEEHATDMEEESRIALARSLCNSVQWEARGGKSGSRFCKTLDDRFVLKEMNSKDITIFEPFAPKYFEYIDKCQQLQLPTLLAKIFGVFKFSVKKKYSFVERSVMVMENLFYGCEISNKFDLKGSERNRLVDPTNQQGEIVLLDENLVQMSWSKPL
ncbi:putative 1-phosphatidylinositol 3-phosphate 5-kinase [Drosophila miranda]|uniref:putative 1-phosphatidylinositol 3-phosphate 5-kinase n=1 Tax=Drosophila miranda TaxID=7229 RepID=UPI00143F372D|nr:putative 1-phosphatidylinositol 3-phosphate 5-kinase [Drosophila miranda]